MKILLNAAYPRLLACYYPAGTANNPFCNYFDQAAGAPGESYRKTGSLNNAKPAL
jgi:hypothetical protein